MRGAGAYYRLYFYILSQGFLNLIEHFIRGMGRRKTHVQNRRGVGGHAVYGPVFRAYYGNGAGGMPVIFALLEFHERFFQSFQPDHELFHGTYAQPGTGGMGGLSLAGNP